MTAGLRCAAEIGPQRVNRAAHHKSKGQRDADRGNFALAGTVADGRAAADEYQRESAEKFG